MSKRPVRIEDVLRLKVVTDPQITPDGSHVLFTVRTVDAKKVYKKAEYRRDLAKYQCDDCDDIWGNGLLMKGKTLVFVGFEY